jgi:ATP-dependent Clp protease adaptor protein ClpS
VGVGDGTEKAVVIKEEWVQRKVILLDDDYNEMNYVVAALLHAVNDLSQQEAERILLTAHLKGSAIVVVCPKEIAEYYQGRLLNYGLTATIEPDWPAIFTSFSASLVTLCALLACMCLFVLSGSVVLYSRLTLPIAVSFAVKSCLLFALMELYMRSFGVVLLVVLHAVFPRLPCLETDLLRHRASEKGQHSIISFTQTTKSGEFAGAATWPQQRL